MRPRTAADTALLLLLGVLGCDRSEPAIRQHLDVGQRTAVEPDIDHRSDEHADHVVQEPVGLHVEAHAPALGAELPLRAREAAAVVRLGRALGGEGAEVVLAEEQRRGSAQPGGVERSAKGPLEAAAKR